MTWGWRRLRRRTGIVSLDTGRSFEGVLYQARGDFLELRQARALSPGAAATPIDGELLLPRNRVEFVQLTQVES